MQNKENFPKQSSKYCLLNDKFELNFARNVTFQLEISEVEQF